MSAAVADRGGLFVSRFERLPLLGQIWLLGLTGGLVLVIAYTQLHAAGTAIGLPWLLAMAVVPLLCASWPALRASRALDRLTGALTRVMADHQDEEDLPYEPACDELHGLSTLMRRELDNNRRKRQALKAQNVAMGVKLQSRTQELSSLQDLSIGLARESEVGGLVNEALGALGSAMSYASASVWARAGLEADNPVVLTGYRSDEVELNGVALGDLTGLRLSRSNLHRYEQIEREGKPIIENRPRQGLLSWLWAMVTDDARTSALYRNTRSWMAVPLKVHTSVLGVLRVDHQEPDYFDEERTRLLSAVAGQTALAMSHANALALQRDVAVVNERNRIARELHDAVSQTLFAANLLAGALARSSETDEAVRGQAQVLERLNRSALAEMRMMLFELRPDALASVRMPELLQQAVEALVGRGGVEVTTDIDDATPLPTAQRIEVYRIAQAALSNIARHSGASHAHLQWATPNDGPAVLRVKDDGCGFVANAEHPGHFGVTNIRERASSLGANLVIQSAPGAGTEIILTLNRSEKTP